jgi:hypothetical protein
MNARHVLALALTAGASASAGWMARGPQPPVEDVPAAPVAARSSVPAAPPGADALARPLIAVSGDGQVTLRVEQQPLDWVLEQIALQTGRADVKEAASPGAARTSRAPQDTAAHVPAEDEAGNAAACPPMAPAEAGQLLRTIEHGGDDERIPALQRARLDGVPVPERVLRQLMESALSDRVRLIALDSWVESRAGDPLAERAALEAALLVPNAALQQAARQRLDDLNETERLDALAAQGSP